MCGIAGIIDFSGTKISLNQASKMLYLLNSRGPDHQGYILEKNYFLGHKKLSILDSTDKSNQPMSGQTASTQIVFNGEIYNYKELYSEYISSSQIIPPSDTEVLVLLWEKLQTKMFPILKGMYSIAILDKDRNIVILVRDHIGIKPLYYSNIGSRLIFSSEITSISETFPHLKQIYKKSFANYLSTGNFNDPDTIYKDIKSIQPGHFLSLDLSTGDSSLQKYYFSKNKKLNESESSIIGNVKKKVIEAIQRHAYKENDFGVMLSGGMDSYIIAYLLNSSSSKKMHTFSLVFSEESYSEKKFSQLSSKKLNSIHHEILITPQIFKEEVISTVQSIGEPTCDPSAVATKILSKYASKHVKVLFSGDGADELFAGYETMAAYRYWRIFKLIPCQLRAVLTKIISIIPHNIDKLSFFYRAKILMHGINKPLWKAYFAWRSIISNSTISSIAPDAEVTAELHYQNIFYKDKEEDSINKMLNLDTFIHLPDKILKKTDRTTMAHSIECRVPFVDIDIVDYLALVPGTLKYKKNIQKYLLKEAFKKEIPTEILSRKKHGLYVPCFDWLKTHYKDWCEENFSEFPEGLEQWIDKEKLLEMWELFISGKKDYGKELWCILGYVLWYKHVYQRNSHNMIK